MTIKTKQKQNTKTMKIKVKYTYNNLRNKKAGQKERSLGNSR